MTPRSIVKKHSFHLQTDLSFEEVKRRVEHVVEHYKDLWRRIEVVGTMNRASDPDDDAWNEFEGLDADDMDAHFIALELTNLNGIWDIGTFAVMYYKSNQVQYVDLECIELHQFQWAWMGLIPISPSFTFGLKDYKVLSARLKRAFKADVYPIQRKDAQTTQSSHHSLASLPADQTTLPGTAVTYTPQSDHNAHITGEQYLGMEHYQALEHYQTLEGYSAPEHYPSDASYQQGAQTQTAYPWSSDGIVASTPPQQWDPPAPSTRSPFAPPPEYL